MADRFRSVSIEELPSHLIFEILMRGQLSAVDLVCLELTSKTFGGSHGLDLHKFRLLVNFPWLDPHSFRSLVDFAAFKLCASHSIYAGMSSNVQKELFDRCNGNWKRILRFLQCVEHSSDTVETSAGKMQITTGRYHTLLISNSSVYSCGSSPCGVLGHGPETKQCVAFTRINFPNAAHVVQVSATKNHAAFVLQSGEVFTCGDNSSFCCGHRDTSRPIFRPRFVEALKGIPCKQVAAGLNFTAFLTRQGHVYTCGTNVHGQLGHGDTLDRPTPKSIALFEEVGSIVQIAAGPSYVLAVAKNGAVYSFGSGSNFCLGHGEEVDELWPRVIQTFRGKGIHVVHVSAGDQHAVALDSSGFVYTWGKGYCGALGHGDEIDKTFPEFLSSLKSHLVVQVCARKSKTFVLVDNGTVYGFGCMDFFGSLGFGEANEYDKVMEPRILDSLSGHRVSQISTGLYHTVVVTQRGQIFGFGSNERSQLGRGTKGGCLKPTEIFIQEMDNEAGLVSESG